MRNWKTTLAGLSAALALAAKFFSGEPITITDLAIVAAALGLFGAKDHNVTGGTKQQ
jgi:hypothetical protein